MIKVGGALSSDSVQFVRAVLFSKIKKIPLLWEGASPLSAGRPDRSLRGWNALSELKC